MTAEFLHAAHQVRDTLGGLQIASWLAIGLAIGALVLSWSRLVAWIRTPDGGEQARVIGWGEDGGGWYFELANGDGASWWAEDESGARAGLERVGGRRWRCASLNQRPIALVSSGGERLTL